MIDVLSFGGGVQSVTVALMVARGEIRPADGGRWAWETPDASGAPFHCLFSDPGWEAPGTYEYLAYLRERLTLPFPIVTVATHDIRGDALQAQFRDAERPVSLPYHTLTQQGATLRKGLTRRQCTAEYKIRPVERWIRTHLLGLERGQHAPRTPVISMMLGISTDEASRMKPSRAGWYVKRYPLAMEVGLSRANCLAWLEQRQYRLPPRSACVGCPLKSDAEWKALSEDPALFADACDFDDAIRRTGGFAGKFYLHPSCEPLRETAFQPDNHDLFASLCEGYCGT